MLRGANGPRRVSSICFPPVYTVCHYVLFSYRRVRIRLITEHRKVAFESKGELITVTTDVDNTYLIESVVGQSSDVDYIQ